ncbi:valine--tRNA ligase [candidate division WOR-1 bacterium RIFOXYB2_FULL_42_35]|uniref:Valine--tRNA ligase n=1 Tax=candidate division WOR-1 bacterium RIFOXYC2_FULL_41_25 TaxID=1802586 RepID=A0A1F4TQP1_UNCSA|nr:MAG: valine--tRNA ligase [candidate division WOR-1 bacterium RIFOXYA2_FULL_41_14]OGC25554.1 MAG: valine--tRNA ligase [candidate division WOR-1 bacterium RIFOXYB2_FULL_42_35]OGC34986.1 MAG: valine--tRNA ligase [candidate division WOR-1 bacterium RIFOXYC2_FULL_41_25]
MNQEIPKIYDPKEVEQKWYKIWEESKLFTPDNNSDKKPFTIVIPPPNVTGNLHMGHALDNSIQDLLIRYKRMQGFNALWIPGTDHAGIATQNVVAKALRKEDLTKDKLGREKFLERVWQWKEEYGGNITRQLRRLGSALDWTRERFTMDEGLSKAVTREFVTLYKDGLVYRGKRLVNWCPKCGTAISDIEVEHASKKGKLWWIKYPLEKSETQNSKLETNSKSEIKNSKQKTYYIVVATTRPETMLGDTAVAVNPKDKRYKKLIGKLLVLPLTNRKIPVIKDDFVDPEFGSGAVKVTPAHDPNDFAMGERHDLPRINILTPDAKITFQEFSEEEKSAIKELEGLDRYKARARIVELLEEKGFLEKIEDYENSVGECYRCKQVIEPYLSDQWYVKVADLARNAIRVVEEGKIKYVPDRWTKVYLQWMMNLKDWCISRQLWWGHRIPVYYCKSEIRNPKSETNSNSKDQNSKQYCEEVIVSETKPSKCPKCGGTQLEQDPDVFDTWFSSALWPFSTLGWPEETKDLKTFYPTDVLVTGYDIITFWVSRMIMMGVHFMKKAPFHTVFIHGLVRDASGKKMSKSFGNVIDPIEIIDQVGADALRFALISLITGQGQDIKLTQDKITEARNFTNKIWNVSRFVLMGQDRRTAGLSDLKDLELADRWILSRYQNTVKDVTELLEGYDFGETARKLYDFLWGEFCDWYVEISKSDLYSDDAKRKQRVQGVLLYVLEGSLRLMHPFMPFISEEISSAVVSSTVVQGERPGFLLQAEWPKSDKNLIDQKAEAAMELLKQMIVKIRNLKAEMKVQTKDIELIFVTDNKESLQALKEGEPFIKTLAKANKVNFVDKAKQKPAQAISAVVADVEFFIPLQGLIDIGAEVERLKNEEQKIELALNQITKLLGNPGFTAKAPPEAIEQQKTKQLELNEKKKIIAERVKALVG